MRCSGCEYRENCRGCNRAKAKKVCESAGLVLTAPNSTDEWTKLLAALPGGLGSLQRNLGFWIAGHDGKSKTIEWVGKNGSDTYSDGKFYPPYGQTRLYVGCNVGEDGLVAVKYSGSGYFIQIICQFLFFLFLHKIKSTVFPILIK